MTNKDSNNKNVLFKRGTIINIIIWLILTSISLGVYYSSPLFSLNENQILYLFSAASQVIAAIYGLIITGYIFLRNELDRKVDKDDSYEQIVSLLKADYFDSIKIISVVTLLSISGCFLVIVDATSFNNVTLDVLINISVSVILTDLILIVSFVIKILNPKSLEIASDKLRARTITSETGEKGSLENFLTNFKEIEYIITKYGKVITNPVFTNYESQKKYKISNPKLVQILFNDDKIDLTLKDDLLKLVSFRNSIIHGTNLFISKQEVDLANDILIRLKKSLNVV